MLDPDQFAGIESQRVGALQQRLDSGGVGLAFAFFSALACVHWLLRYVASHDFIPFAWYRIAFGLIVLTTAWTGVVNWSA